MTGRKNARPDWLDASDVALVALQILPNARSVKYINAMNVSQINGALLVGEIDRDGVFPHLDALKRAPVVFEHDIGLNELPTKPGIILIRGARQYGKSTWLEQKLYETVVQFGVGSGLYLNGDEIRDSMDLIENLRTIISLFPPTQQIRRIFIDEITAIDNWQKALKRLADAGELRDILVVTTGSKATDLRRGTERLPGRKGMLARSWYHFPPLSYRDFLRAGGSKLGEDALISYMISGGCPIAAGELIEHRILPEYITEMVRDWVYGEVVASGRNRSSLLGVMDSVVRFGGTPCGQAKLAREAGLANNTVAAGYLELLMDLMCIGAAAHWDAQKNAVLHRKPAKYHFTNLLVAVAWHSDRPESVSAFRTLSPQKQGVWYEWAVAQELWRRAALKGEEFPEVMRFWQGKEHEIDFVVGESDFIEVKRGEASPMEFTWLPKVLPKARLRVINAKRFDATFCKGITLEDFLLEDDAH